MSDCQFNIGLNRLVNALELLFILFSINPYYFRLICGLIPPNIEYPLIFIPVPTPASNSGGQVIRMQKSDAGVGIGTLIGDRDYIARK